MKKTIHIATLLIIIIIQITACKKKDLIKDPRDQECQITQLTYTVDTFNRVPRTATFTYNSAGNPVSMVVSNAGTGHPHALFMYDQYNRLTDHMGTYLNFTDPAKMPPFFVYEYWVKYVYADQNPSSMPIRDTIRSFGGFRDGKFESTSFMTVENLTYDSRGRIIRGAGYDANGNLILPKVTYDNKKNYRHTNKIWMLIDKDYSVNNPFTALTYNDAGYPASFPALSTPTAYRETFLRRHITFLTMNYSCSVVKATKKA